MCLFCGTVLQIQGRALLLKKAELMFSVFIEIITWESHLKESLQKAEFPEYMLGGSKN